MMATPLTPGLMMIQGNRPEALLELFIEWVARHPLAPLENETILVQSNGIAQWIKQEMARRCGIAAALDVVLPSSFLWRAFRLVLGEVAVPKRSLLDKAPLTWRLMRVLPQIKDQESFAVVKRFLDNDPEGRKLFQLSESLADLYDQYQFYRGDWLADWKEGRDIFRNGEGRALSLATDDRWQADLWRSVVQGLPKNSVDVSRANVHNHFLKKLEKLAKPPSGLPRRITVFGISALPAQSVEALAALAKFSQVFLFVNNPCQHYWGDIVTEKDLSRPTCQQRRPRQDQSNGHPLLAAWGKQGRDYLHMLAQFDEPQRYRSIIQHETRQDIDLFEPPGTTTLLGQLQNDLFDLRPLEESRQKWPLVVPEKDYSVRFHITHSKEREIEILHDQLLARFSADPTLEARDVIVMMPDVDAYAPHIQAVFGRQIPYALADRRQRGQRPLLLALETLLTLPESRFAASEILDLLEVAALRSKFGMEASDLPLLKRWIEDAGIRWGLDTGQRQAQALAAAGETNTWLFGFKRMMMGFAVGASDPDSPTKISPYEEIGGLQAALAGSLWRLMQTLSELRIELSSKASPEQWVERFKHLLNNFFLLQNTEDQRDWQRLNQLLEAWRETTALADFTDPIPLSVAKEAWLQGLDHSGLQQRFLTGAVSFCTLMPMRTIPFRLVCLIGMDDGAYPRPHFYSDFDLMQKHYRPGDRSRREDDRYLLLEALLSAREQLYISWVGRDLRDNSELPPSVLIGQLRDHLNNGWRLAEDSRNVTEALTQLHPLQVFSRRYYSKTASRKGIDGIYTYADEWRAAIQGEEEPKPLPEFEPEDGVLPLSHLQSFFERPVAAFFQQRLNTRFKSKTIEEAEDNENFDENNLTSWRLNEDVCSALMFEVQQNFDRFAQNWSERIDYYLDRLQKQGRLPLAVFGEFARDVMKESLTRQTQQLLELLATHPQPCELQPITMQKGDIVVNGMLGHLWTNAAGDLVRVRLSGSKFFDSNGKLRNDKPAREWLGHVASQVHFPQGVKTVLIGQDDQVVLASPSVQTAQQWLEMFIAAWRQGMRAPLPVTLKTALAWLSKANIEDARKVYEGDGYSLPERDGSPELMRAFPDFKALHRKDEKYGFEYWAMQLYALYLDQLPSNSVARKKSKGKES